MARTPKPIEEIFPGLTDPALDPIGLMMNSVRLAASPSESTGSDEFLKSIEGEMDKNRLDLEDLKNELLKHNIRVGKVVGMGIRSIIFEMNDEHGKPLEHSVLRIEGKNGAHTMPSPGMMPMLGKIDAELYEAVIVPRGQPMKKAKTPEEKVAQLAELKRTFEFINASGPDALDRLMDMNNPIDSQFIRLPGVDVPVFSDLNGVLPPLDPVMRADILAKRAAAATDAGRYNIKPFKCSLGDIETFCESHKLNYLEVRTAVASADEINKASKQVNAVVEKANAELAANHINLRVTTRQVAATIEPVANRAERTVA